MPRTILLVFFISSIALPAAEGAQLILTVDSVEGTSWRGEGIRLSYDSPTELRLEIARIQLAGGKPIRNLLIHCPKLRAGQGADCENASFAATLPGATPSGGTRVQGTLKAHFTNPRSWRAELVIPTRKLRATLEQDSQRLRASASLGTQAAAEVAKLAEAFGVKSPGEIAGKISLTLDAELRDSGTRVAMNAVSADLTFSEPSGRYATDKLAASVSLHWASREQRWEVKFEGRGGQAYVEPVFLDFAASPLRIDARLRDTPPGWRIERVQAAQTKAGTVEISGLLGKDFKPKDLDARLDATDVGPMFTSFVQPFLIGTKLDGASLGGRAKAQISIRGGAPASVAATLENAVVSAEKLGVSLQGLSGALNWATARAASSRLRWSGGALQRVPLGPSEIAFRAQDRDFELLSAWRQPLLEGALKVERLALRGMGSPQLAADFQGAVEPIDLATLCKALEWPEFGGTLGGRLPGLTVRNDVWAVDGALEAQLFDGGLRIENLRAIEPFGVLPRVTADLAMRRLNLEQLTGAFSFGRITGRLDGDVRGLRLLNWSPVAFDAKLYSTPGDRGSRRISQRAIDNISSIGGGPTGVLSRGVLSIFEDFAYDRLGIGCVLRDGVCLMGGIESTSAPGKARGAQKGYILVKGRLLPRIDVVGYAERVSWTRLIEQLKAVQASEGPQTGPQKK